MQVDFLVVAALEDEAEEIRQRLKNVRPEAEFVVGSVERWKGLGHYTVGVLDLCGMGTNNAQLVTQDAIGLYRPRAVLMTGIAAGFQDSESKVALGDLMIPYGIVPYELAKLRGAKPQSDNTGSPTPPPPESVPAAAAAQTEAKVEHRGVAWAVSQSLWRTAATLARERDEPWRHHVAAARPDGVGTPPKLHALVDTVIGCGEKVVAAAEAEVRNWLLASYPRQILGLEMESYGGLLACRAFDTPFLMAKASVDRATVEKDDGWRTYACQISAAFLLTVIERYERPVTRLVARHQADCDTESVAIKGHLPSTDFQYKIRTARSFSQIRQKAFDPEEREASSLLPTSLHPVVVLYAGGGSGKTTVARRLFRTAIVGDQLPVLLDLRRCSGDGPAPADPQEDREGTDWIVRTASIPRRTAREIEHLTEQIQVILIIDGANEISKVALADLAAYCQRLQNRGGCRIVWTNRMSLLESIPPRALHATIDKVPVAVARECFDAKFKAGRFDELTPRLQSIMLRPFFLDLAIRTGREFAGNRLWSGIFSEFFREHPSLTDQEIDDLARATRAAMSDDGRLNRQELTEKLSETIRGKLRSAQVRVLEDGEFEHHLWRDYLLSRAIKLDPAGWTEETFDAATTFGTSAESLSMAVEQLAGADDKVRFVKTVYDWNYGAALECVARSGADEESERHLPEEVGQAILAVVAEKRFDPVPRTAERTHRLLTQYSFAKDYLDEADRDAMCRRAARIAGDDSWVGTWRALYTKRPGEPVTDAEVDLIGSDDSLVGWTAANFARRGQLSTSGQDRVRGIYRNQVPKGGRRSIRWRAVHVLGRWPTVDNVALLAEALRSDPYHWVKYGAARSLVEIAARSAGEIREKATQALQAFVADGQSGGFARHVILEEIVEASFLDDALPDWPQDAMSLLEATAGAEPSPDRQAGMARRVSEFTERLGPTAPGPSPSGMNQHA